MQPSFNGIIELPATAQLLTDGGDARILTDSASGLNKYGCRPYPDPGLAVLGSSTASLISEQGYAAAHRLRARLQDSAATEAPATSYARELERIREELLTLWGIPDRGDVDLVFAASGTDAHLIAAQWIDAAADGPLCAVMVESAETGGGVRAALSGRHFSGHTALGATVGEGAPLASQTIALEVVPIRFAHGEPRPAEEIDAEISRAVAAAVARGQHVLLTLVDVSKTGLIAPSPVCVAALQQAFPDRLSVLVDACQFRLAPSTLRAYLRAGYLVAMTGSKFMGGPSFAGALLLPAVVAKRARPLPPTLLNYSAAADWPPRWRDSGLQTIANYGLLLRWEAALTEMRAFYALPEQQVAEFLQTFADAIIRRLQQDAQFELLPVPALDRRPLAVASGWDSLPTIFPFLLYRAGPAGSRMPLGREATALVYQRLQQDLSAEQDAFAPGVASALAARRFQLGQPVLCGNRGDVPVSALRLCLSARSVVAAMASGGQGAASVIAQAMAALDKIALLVGAIR